LLKTACAEVCGTDVHLWHGRLAGVPYPIIPGHISAGTLDSIRGTLLGIDGTLLREGDRVVFFDVHRACGRCRACTVHRTPTRCPTRRVYGITDSADEGLFGGWAQAIYLEGVGAVGLSAIALARLAGASTVIAIGAPDDRLDLARRMGADLVFHLDSTVSSERLEQVRAVTYGEGADVVVEAAGSAKAVEEGLDLVRDGGRYVIAGHYTDVGATAINAHRHINRKHLEIRGCWGSEPRHFLRALALLERHSAEIPWIMIGSRLYGLGQLNEALADAEQMRIPKALVDPWA
jgi:threonine dehydrogenase-like Zn-dependent dehydrogenase